MYSLNTNLVDDNKGVMTGNVPNPKSVGWILNTLFNTADKLAELYNVMMRDYKTENDCFAIFYDITDILEQIDLDDVNRLADNYCNGFVYSSCEKWIITPLCDLYYRGGNDITMSVEGTLLSRLQSITDECEYIPASKMHVLAASLYAIIAAMYSEIYNTYGVDRWITGGNGMLLDITRGYNEFLIMQNASCEEMARSLFERINKFVHVTNEVDRDPEVAKKIRDMVPADLMEMFEDNIELITEEQVQDILNGKIRINSKFITSLGEEEVVIDNEDDQ